LIDCLSFIEYKISCHLHPRSKLVLEHEIDGVGLELCSIFVNLHYKNNTWMVRLACFIFLLFWLQTYQFLPTYTPQE